MPRRLLDSVLPPIGAAKAITTPSAPQSEKSKASPAKRSKSVTMAAPVPTPSTGMNIVDHAIGILAEEIGVQVSELSNEASFADMGVDSLLSLTISGKFREELDAEVESSIFADCPSVKDLKQYFSKNHSAATSTPETSHEETKSEASGDESMTPIEDEEGGPLDDVVTSIPLILAEEFGVSIAEIADMTNLAQLSMDSLMTLAVTGRMREELGMEVASNLFRENNTIIAAADALGLKPKPAKISPPTPNKMSSLVQKSLRSAVIPAASSILLQGNPKIASKTLWLFPDGSGSATSYAPLSRISDDVAVYGPNCHYMKTPQDLKCSLEGITPPYLVEIRRRHPRGPYYFGGWSAGGISAFDAAQQIIGQGEEVSRLIFLDSPFPIGLEKLPRRLYDFFQSIGMFGTGKQGPPDWLIGHFLAFVDALDKYRAVPFAAGKAPTTHMI